jgi:hypothetical protein
VVSTALAVGASGFGEVPIENALTIWAYDIVALIIIDILKVEALKFLGESIEVIPASKTSQGIKVGTDGRPAPDEEEEAAVSVLMDAHKGVSSGGKASRRRSASRRLEGGVHRLSAFAHSVNSNKYAVSSDSHKSDSDNDSNFKSMGLDRRTESIGGMSGSYRTGFSHSSRSRTRTRTSSVGTGGVDPSAMGGRRPISNVPDYLQGNDLRPRFPPHR